MNLTSLSDLLTLFANDPRSKQATEALTASHARIRLSGLIGSGRSLAANAIREKRGGTHVFTLGDKEEAASFMNDLEALQAVRTGAPNGAPVASTRGWTDCSSPPLHVPPMIPKATRTAIA
ncbi:MAG: hypothetical protein IPI95_14445 [Flavobacteriales bacterium]|nr:hypothetical protein [Flavobacteriales bacterium]